MTMVWSDPAGYAVDWDWHRSLTVWELTGRPATTRYGRRLLEHELAAGPADERRARSAAGKWWRRTGRAETVSKTTGGAAGPEGDHP